MTDTLQKAFEAAAQLPESEQDAIGRWMLHELASERKWDELFANSQQQLAKLGDEAVQEFRRGETVPLDDWNQ